MQMKTYLRAEWDKKKQRIAEGSSDVFKAMYDFQFDFGENDEVFKIVNTMLWVHKPPPEPD